MTQKIMPRLARFALPVGLACALGACATDTAYNRGLDPVHQPVVSYASYVFDVSSDERGALSATESQRLEGWLSSIDVGYGDQVAIATESGYYGRAMRDGIASVIARHGLLVENDSSAQAGRAPEGSVRIIVRRASASVPNCPDWSINEENTIMGAASSNFGCGVNANVAAMIANPHDLVRGETTNSDLRTATSNRAIATYRDKAPTGAGDLKSITPGGSN